MNILPTRLPGVLLIEPRVFGDDRGFFFESFNARAFAQATGVTADFVQDNHSHSARGVLRGLHYQVDQPQGKLVRVASGAVLDVVVDYLNTRTTFGRKIGSYQSLKHTCADILVSMERSRSHVYHCATLVTEGVQPQALEVALRMAKVESGDGFVFAGDRAVQFHGGFGFTWDCDAQLFLRRALWLQHSFGDAAHHRRRLADLLLPH